MATYILFWNPAFSSYTMDRFEADFCECDWVGNWSFYEHEGVKAGDRFYMVRCGEGKTGLVMSGIITSECYESEDWSPKKRRHIFYADLKAEFTVDIENIPERVTPEMLTEAVPGFNWYGGHAGVRLDEKDADALGRLWLRYLDTHPEYFREDYINFHDFGTWNGNYDETNAMRDVLRSRTGYACQICGYDYGKVFPGSGMRINLEKVTDERLRHTFYCVCDNCWRGPKEERLAALEANEGQS